MADQGYHHKVDKPKRRKPSRKYAREPNLGPATGHAELERMIAAYCGERGDWGRVAQERLYDLTHDQPLDQCWIYHRNDYPLDLMTPVGAWRENYQDRTHWEGDGDGVPSYLKKMTLEELREIRRPTGRYYPILREFVESGEEVAEVNVTLLGTTVERARNGFEAQLRRVDTSVYGKVVVRERKGRLFLVRADIEI